MNKDDKNILNAPLRNTSLVAGIFNLCKSAIGVGILSLPLCMAKSGILLGLALLVFGSLTTSSTLHFLSRIAANTDMGDYFELGRLAFGSTGEILAVVSCMLYLFGGLIAYANYTGVYFTYFISYVLGVERGAAWYTNSGLIVAISAGLIFPLALLRDLSKLARASIAGMICMSMVCALTVTDYFVDSSEVAAAQYEMAIFSSGAIEAFTNILFAFCNHFTMLAIVPTLINPTPSRRNKLLTVSSVVVFVFYALVSAFGYLHFGQSVHGNILLARSTATLPYAIAQFLVASVIICSFPLLCDPTKKLIEMLISKMVGAPKGAASLQLRNLAVTGCLVAGSSLVAIFAAKAVLPILGSFTSLCGSLLMFVFPAGYFLRLRSKYRVHGWESAVAYFDIGLGLIVMVVGTYFNVYETIMTLTGNK